MSKLIVVSYLLISSTCVQKIKELAGKARAGKLKPNEFQGGTFR